MHLRSTSTPASAGAASFLALLLLAGTPALAAENTGTKALNPPLDLSSLAPGRIHWQPTFEAALELARQQDRPLMVDFEAEWCGFCKKLDRETYGDARVIRFVQEFFISVKVDGDRRVDLREQHAVEGYPTIVFLSAHGVELNRIEGFRPPKEFLAEAGKAARSSGALAKLRKEAEARPDDADAQRAYGRALASGGNVAAALALLEAFHGRHPGVGPVHLDLADFLRATGRLEEACEHYEAVITAGVVPPSTSGTAARRDETAAREVYRTAHLSLAETRVSLKEYDKGIRVLTAFLRLEPAQAEHLEALFLRAYAHAALRQPDAALGDLRAAEELDKEGFWGLRASLIRALVDDGDRTEP